MPYTQQINPNRTLFGQIQIETPEIIIFKMPPCKGPLAPVVQKWRCNAVYPRVFYSRFRQQEPTRNKGYRENGFFLRTAPSPSTSIDGNFPKCQWI